MADTYTLSLRIAQQEIGANENTWGTINNAALAMVEEAIAGRTDVTLAGSNVTLSTANNATDQSRPPLLVFSGSPGAARTVTAPDKQKLYWVRNNTGDGSSVTFNAGAGTSVSVPSGFTAAIYCDGATNAVALLIFPTGGTGVTTTAGQTLTNKTLTAAVLGGTTNVSGGQLQFPASQSASADANTLDDYEEGTFTPGFAFGGGTTGITYLGQAGAYTKIGNRVLFDLNVTLSNKGSSTGTATVTGLPFSASAAAPFAHFSVRYSLINLDTAGGYYSPSTAMDAGDTNIALHEQGDNVGVVGSITDADFGNSSSVRISGEYRV